MKKTIVMYTPAKLFDRRLTGGMKRFLELFYGLKEKEFYITLFTGDSSEKIGDQGEHIKSINYVKPIKSIWIPSIAISFIKNYKIIKKIKKMKYDSLIIFDVPTAISFCILRVAKLDLFLRQDLLSYKAISIRERIKSKFVQRIYLKLMKIAERICILKSRRIIVQCEYDKNQLYDRHKSLKDILDEKITVQINNVNPTWIVEKSSLEENSTLLKRENQNDCFKIGFIGDFSNERKGHRILVDAIKSLIDRGLKVEAILIGDGKQLNELKNECVNYPQLIFTGRLDNPIRITKQCDLMVVPSLADSCPNTIMEALYNRIPVIGAKSGGIPEILENEDALFKPNSNSLETKIESLIDKKNLLKLKIQQNIRRKELEFDWSAEIIQHLELTDVE